MRSRPLTPALLLVALLCPVPHAQAKDADLPQQLKLEQALDLAVERNLSLAAAREDLARAEAAYKKAWASLLPLASAGLDYTLWDHANTTRMSDPSSPDGEREITIRNQQDLAGNLSISAPLVQAQAWWSVRLGDLGREQARVGQEALRQNVLLGVAQTFILAQTSKSLIKVQQEQIRRAEKHLAVADMRHRSGTGKRVDVLRARGELLDAKDQLLAAESSYDNARDALASLLGAAPGSPLPEPQDSGELKPPAENDARLEERALKLREDLRLGRLALRQADERLTQVWLGFLPSLNATWQLSYQFTEPSSFGSVDRSRWFIGLTLDLPLYDHTRYAQLDEGRAALRQARAQLADSERQARLEIRQAGRAYRLSQEQLKLARQKMELNREALELTELAYINGTGSSLEVTDARRNWRTSEINLASKRLDAQLRLLEWLRRSGQDLSGLSDP